MFTLSFINVIDNVISVLTLINRLNNLAANVAPI